MATKVKKPIVLVTGSQGFLGQNLLPILEKKYRIYEWDKKTNGEDIFDLDFQEMVRVSDVVIHLAALVSVPKSFKSPEDTFYTNVLGTARVVELCTRYKKKLVFVSSAAAYHPESSPYAYSKWLGEELVRGVKRKIPTVILRLFNVYGEGANKDSIMQRFLTDKRITVNGDGEQTRDFINVKDVSLIIADAVKNKWNGKVADIGIGESHDIYFLADTFRHFRGHKKIYYGKPVKEIKESKADVTVLNSLYKEILKTDLVADIERMVKNAKT